MKKAGTLPAAEIGQGGVADQPQGAARMNQLAECRGFSLLYPHPPIASDAHCCWCKHATQQGLSGVVLPA